MYNNKLVASIKANNKILREFKDVIYVPYGIEYSILLKNLNTKRAQVNITIDGEAAVTSGLILNAGQEIDLERWVKTNLNEGNKFKFIERTAGIENHRGIKPDDGIIRIEYQYELDLSNLLGSTGHVGQIQGGPYTHNPIYTNSGIRGQVTPDSYTITCNAAATSNTIRSMSATYNDAGITVPGSTSTQQFKTVPGFICEHEKHVMVLKLLGETPDNKPVLDPVTVTSKTKCVTCGIQAKRTAKYCSHCGTSLVIYA